jgi:hypothetical protein
MMLVEKPRQRLQSHRLRSEQEHPEKVIVDSCLSHDGFVEGRLICDSTV